MPETDDKLTKIMRERLDEMVDDIFRSAITDSATTAAAPPDEPVTAESIMAAVKDLPKRPRDPFGLYPLGFGMPVYEIANPAIVGYREARSPGHPFIKWLARFIPFDPDVIYDEPIYDTTTAYRIGDRLLMTRESIAAIKMVST